MSVNVKFKVGLKKNINTTFNVEKQEPIKTTFRINAGTAAFSSLIGNPYDNNALAEALNLKASNEALTALAATVTNNYITLDNKIDEVQSDLSGDISVLEQTVNDNNTAVNNRIDTTNQAVANLSTTVASNNTAINNRVDSIVDSFDGDISALETAIENEATTRANNDILLSGDINTLQNNLTSEISNRVVADNTLQENIDTLASDLSDEVTARENADSTLQGNIDTLSNTVTNNYNTLDAKIDSTSDDLSGDISNLTQIVNNNYTTLDGKITTLSSTVSSNYTTLNTKIDNTKNAIDSDISDLSDTVTQNYTDLDNAITASASTINSRIDSEVSILNTAISTENTQRQSADNNLQSQIDAIVAASDVFDIVGTYAELQAYDITTVPVNDIIKVLVDSMHDGAATYYRCVENNNVKSWSYIGSEGAYYTKGEADSKFVEQTTTINNKPLSNNITLDASDVGALPANTVIGSGVLTIQVNGSDVDTFNANATANKSINIPIPTVTVDKTFDGTSENAQSGVAIEGELSANYATKSELPDTVQLNYYGTSDTPAADANKVVSIPAITELNVGQIIIVQPSITNTAGDSTLQLNDFPAYPIRYANAALSTTTDSYCWSATYPSGFIFDGDYWRFIFHGTDINTTYILNHSCDAGRYISGNGTYAITRYSLVMQKPDLTWEKITATNRTYTTATNKTVNTNGFLLNQIRYYNTTTILANGAKAAVNTMYSKSASTNFAYSTNCGTAPGWAIGDYIYLVGTVGTDGLFYLDTTKWWDNALPTTNDGKLYIQLGQALTTTDSTITLYEERPVFYHNGTRICEYKIADNKQDLIPDLTNIRAGATAGSTAIQPSAIADMATQTWVRNQNYLTSASLSGYQPLLVSGTNIKTINNNSLLGDGNITIDSLPSQTGQSGKFLTTNGTSASWATVNADNIFWATYGTTTFTDIMAAINAGKLVMCSEASGGSTVTFIYRSHTSSTVTFYNVYDSGNTLVSVDSSNNWDLTDNTFLPSQTGNSGKLLTTNGSAASWTSIKTINNTSLLGSGDITVSTSIEYTKATETLRFI